MCQLAGFFSRFASVPAFLVLVAVITYPALLPEPLPASEGLPFKPIAAESDPSGRALGSPADCSEFSALLERQRTAISGDIGQVKREIAALREEMSRPGMKEVIAGLGYIFGLAGIGFYLQCRRKSN